MDNRSAQTDGRMADVGSSRKTCSLCETFVDPPPKIPLSLPPPVHVRSLPSVSRALPFCALTFSRTIPLACDEPPVGEVL